MNYKCYINANGLITSVLTSADFYTFPYQNASRVSAITFSHTLDNCIYGVLFKETKPFSCKIKHPKAPTGGAVLVPRPQASHYSSRGALGEHLAGPGVWWLWNTYAVWCETLKKKEFKEVLKKKKKDEGTPGLKPDFLQNVAYGTQISLWAKQGPGFCSNCHARGRNTVHVNTCVSGQQGKLPLPWQLRIRCSARLWRDFSSLFSYVF